MWININTLDSERKTSVFTFSILILGGIWLLVLGMISNSVICGFGSGFFIALSYLPIYKLERIAYLQGALKRKRVR